MAVGLTNTEPLSRSVRVSGQSSICDIAATASGPVARLVCVYVNIAMGFMPRVTARCRGQVDLRRGPRQGSGKKRRCVVTDGYWAVKARGRIRPGGDQGGVTEKKYPRGSPQPGKYTGFRREIVWRCCTKLLYRSRVEVGWEIEPRYPNHACGTLCLPACIGSRLAAAGGSSPIQACAGGALKR